MRKAPKGSEQLLGRDEAEAAAAPDPQETCWTVVRAASEGDAEARSTFGRSYASAIRGFLEARWRASSPLRGEIDDAVQEVFVECLKPGGVLDRADPERGDFRGLLFGVARNVARRCEERALARGRVRPDDEWLGEVASDDPGQETVFDRNWARTLLRLCRRRHRALAFADGEAGRRRIELLERRFGDNEAIRDIAARWGVPTAQVHQAYRKARAEFYRCLRDVVARHAPAGADVDAECRRLLHLVG